jgi:signal transduction histidine kinase
VDVAYELTPLVIGKLVVYTFGSLVHFFLMVLILGNRRLHRLEWLLFGLMSGLFLWYAGNLLALNISLPYGAGPAVQSGISRTISIVGFLAAVPLLVHVQAEYLAKVVPVRVWVRVLVACFYVPVIFSPWIVGRLLGHLGEGPLVDLGPLVRLLVLWTAASLLFAAGINGYLSVPRRPADPVFAKFHLYLGVLQALLALGWGMAYLPHGLPIGGGLGGYLPSALMLAGIFPSGLMGYCIFRYNFLDLRVPRNVVYSVAAIFGSLIYLNFMLRVSGWLETHGVLPAAVTEAVMIFILVVLVEPLRGLISRALHEQFVTEFEIIQKLAAELEDHAKRTGDADSLQKLVEDRVPHQLGLERVRLLRGPSSGNSLPRSSPQPHPVPIVRGGKEIATLEVVTATGEVSGDQRAALEILAGRLAAALELCGLIADKISLERELAAKERMAFLGEMAARIAHNVKNPLSGMKTILQLMEEDATLPDGARRDCHMILDEIDRLNRNISQVLRYAKPARDTDRPADLAKVVKRVVAISRTEAEQRRVTFEVSAPDPCPVEGGEEAASDIVSNLVVNALEASDDGSAIRIWIGRQAANPQNVELIVEDRGRGVPKDRLEKIFQAFYTTRAGGTGLGLAIVKRRLDEIGGSVHCQSPLEDGNADAAHPGTRFVVRFRGAGSPKGKRLIEQVSGRGNSSVA